MAALVAPKESKNSLCLVCFPIKYVSQCVFYCKIPYIMFKSFCAHARACVCFFILVSFPDRFIRFFPVSCARSRGLKNDRILLFLYMQIVIITRKEKTRARARNFSAIHKPIHKRFPPRFFFIFFYSRIRTRGTGHGEEGTEESESIYFLTPASLRARVCVCVYTGCSIPYNSQ